MVKNLKALELRGKPYECIQRLSFEVNKSEQMLKDLDATDRLRTEVELVTDLVGKLAEHF